ncbi:MAG: hypothetical protein K0B00_07930 [Rhodobacteraceae bacterium]|nr:hypothetical protein [Paracoccaceae bacterium]
MKSTFRLLAVLTLALTPIAAFAECGEETHAQLCAPGAPMTYGCIVNNG